MFQSRKATTMEERERKERKKRTLWTTARMKTDTPNPIRKSEIRMQMAALGMLFLSPLVAAAECERSFIKIGRAHV